MKNDSQIPTENATDEPGALPRALPRYRRAAGREAGPVNGARQKSGQRGAAPQALPQAPPILLTPRDLAVLEDVWHYRFLTTSQLETLRACDPHVPHRFVSRLTLTRRLKLLFHHRYLRRIARPLAKGSREPVYLLDSEGARVLSVIHGEVSAPPPSRLPAPAALDHLLAIGQMRLSLQGATQGGMQGAKGDALQGAKGDALQGAKGAEEYRLLEWLPGERVRFRVTLEEAGRRKQNVSLVPDGGALVRLTGLQPNGFVRHHAFIEVDRGTEPQRTLAAKCRAYAAYWQGGGFARDFQVPVGLGFRVLFVAPTAKRLQTIAKAIASNSGPHQLFRVALQEEITPQRVLQAVWWDVDSGQQVPPFG